MCGIFGCSKLTGVTFRMLPHLAWEMENRGKDSWGCSNGVDEVKYIGPITDTWNNSIEKWNEWSWFIAHTRSASTGGITVENQHPFTIEYNGKRLVGIHNGIVANHESLNKKHKREYECDSPHIFAALAGMSPTNEVYGYGNLAWFEMPVDDPRSMSMNFLKFNSDNLYIARLKTGEIVFASTREPIIRAAKIAGGEVEKFYGIEGDKRYYISVDVNNPDFDILIEQKEKVPFGNRNGGYSGDTLEDLCYGRVFRNGRPFQESISVELNGPLGPNRRRNISMVGEKDRMNNICLTTGCTNKVSRNRTKEVVCISCIAQLLNTVEWEGSER